MKRLSRFKALIISALFLTCSVFAVTAMRGEVKIPQNIQQFVQMCR